MDCSAAVAARNDQRVSIIAMTNLLTATPWALRAWGAKPALSAQRTTVLRCSKRLSKRTTGHSSTKYISAARTMGVGL